MSSKLWTVTEEISKAIKFAKDNPFHNVTIEVPNINTQLAAEITLNELSMIDEAASRVIVKVATVH